MITKQNSTEQATFIADYAAHLMGCGIHTSRVIRNTKRIGKSLNIEVNISVFQKSIILTLNCNETFQTFSEVIEIPSLPISFKHNAELSALSWEAMDNKLSLAETKEKFRQIITAPRMHPFVLLVLVGMANAAFCRLFNGDWISVLVVFFATLGGFYVRTQLLKKSINHYIVFIVSAFVASILSAATLFFNASSDTALATSVLFLIPGVPLINGVIDIIEGHTLTGISRLTSALLLIVCIAIGLSFTLLLLKNQLI